MRVRSPRLQSILGYEPNAYVINHLNIALSKKILRTTIIPNRRTLQIVKVLYQIGCIRQFMILNQHKLNGKVKKILRFTVLFYKTRPYFKGVRLVSTCSRKFRITLSGLKVAMSFLKASVIILSTSKGVMSHNEAINLGIGGLILCVLN